MTVSLPRDVLKWLQSLDLSYPVKNSRRDFSNGYLLAEIFSWYYPQEIQMHSFDNGTSIETKVGNWSIIQQLDVSFSELICHSSGLFLQKQELKIPRDEIEGTIHCKPGAASLLIQRVYTILTKRSIPTLRREEVDFSDNGYQKQLPFHARSTATQAIKNNIANSEYVTEPDGIVCGQKAENIIRVHVKNRQDERKEDPKRFGIKPTLYEKSPRKTTDIKPEEYYDSLKSCRSPQNKESIEVLPVSSAENTSVKEISVKQYQFANR